MSTQPKAIVLATKLELHGTQVMEEAATELRRLHAANIDCVDHFNAIKAERDGLLASLERARRHIFMKAKTPNDFEFHAELFATISKARG